MTGGALELTAKLHSFQSCLEDSGCQITREDMGQVVPQSYSPSPLWGVRGAVTPAKPHSLHQHRKSKSGASHPSQLSNHLTEVIASPPSGISGSWDRVHLAPTTAKWTADFLSVPADLCSEVCSSGPGLWGGGKPPDQPSKLPTAT